MIEELVNGERMSRILCPGVPGIPCGVTFRDSISTENLIEIFEHLKVYHSILYEHYHDNIHLWLTPTSKKVRMDSVREELAEENGCGQTYRFDCFEILLDDSRSTNTYSVRSRIRIYPLIRQTNTPALELYT